ncbi:MAG: hypothetical protein OEY14_16975 [Myxococcales bacterium]|nr:hypothetical protein [Myxococcales bacterium]
MPPGPADEALPAQPSPSERPHPSRQIQAKGEAGGVMRRMADFGRLFVTMIMALLLMQSRGERGSRPDLTPEGGAPSGGGRGIPGGVSIREA